MKKIFAVYIFLIIILSNFFAVKITIYCDANYPPYSFADGEKADGIYVEIVRRAVKNIKGYEITFEPVAWQRGLWLMETGEGFALIPPYYRPKERPFLIYSEPILEEKVTLLVRKEIYTKQREKWPDDYLDLIIGINKGFLNFKKEDRNKLKIEEAKDNKSNILKLILGRIDAYANEKNSIIWEMKDLKEKKLCTQEQLDKLVIDKTIYGENAYLVITTKDKNQYPFKYNFIKFFNAELKKLKYSREIDKIIDEYLKK